MNVTLSLDEKIVEAAREVARQQGTSLNALIRQYLELLAGTRSSAETARELQAMWAEQSGNSGGQRFRSDDVYEERLARPRK
jgi:hypothetical protein